VLPLPLLLARPFKRTAICVPVEANGLNLSLPDIVLVREDIVEYAIGLARGSGFLVVSSQNSDRKDLASSADAGEF
jgi:hypothetical protein